MFLIIIIALLKILIEGTRKNLNEAVLVITIYVLDQTNKNRYTGN